MAKAEAVNEESHLRQLLGISLSSDETDYLQISSNE